MVPSPRRIQTTDGTWISRKTAERLQRRGRVRWTGTVWEVIQDLAPAELNRQLASIPRPKVQHSPQFSKLLHHANPTDQYGVDLRPALPISPEWLKRMGYRVSINLPR